MAALNQPALLHLEVTTEQLLGVLVHTCGCHSSWHGSGVRICQAFAQGVPVCHPVNAAPFVQQQYCPDLPLLSRFNLKILPCLRISNQRASSVRENLPTSCGRSGQKQRPAGHDIVAGVLAVQQPDCASLRTCTERSRAYTPVKGPLGTAHVLTMRARSQHCPGW